MKPIAIVTLMLLLLCQTFSKWAVVASFELNREAIARNLCENRTRPQLKCKGSCVLMKKLKQEEEQEKNTPAPLKMESMPVAISSRSFFATALSPVFSSGIRHFEKFNPGKPVDRSFAVFHPPTA